MNALSGGVAGRIGGPISSGGRFDAASPWLDKGIAAGLNEMEDIARNTARDNFLRSLMGGTVSSLDYVALTEDCP